MALKLPAVLRANWAPPAGVRPVDFAAPRGAAALFAPDSVTWRIMKNPVSLMIGGVAAVLLELAEPRVRTGVWEHTRFRDDPVGRIRRTGHAAMVTTYAPAEAARAMISGIVRAHERVQGVTPAGVLYRASDPELLNWVQATAGFGFIGAYDRFVRPLSAWEWDHAFAEGAEAAALYGATGAPRSRADWELQLANMTPRLESSGIVHEFLQIMRHAALLPAPLKPLQGAAISAAIAMTPAAVRDLLRLPNSLNRSAELALKALGAAADRAPLKGAPPVEACVRLGLAPNHLYRGAYTIT
ncbi:MAG: oxygenase MpaB family protein [Hyphomonadaceae bacterium]